MIRRLAVLALVACAAPAYAAWEELETSPIGTLSIDSGSIRTREGKTSFTYRIDLPAPQKNGNGNTYQSAVIEAFVSCKEHTIAALRSTVYAQSGGKGAIVDRGTYPGTPKAAASNGTEAHLFKAACAKSRS